jgi:NAD(P)-dependent dehydrogenase (short-subunit alcohol dehydrogenase family)
LVTGASGNVGRAVISALLAAGAEVAQPLSDDVRRVLGREAADFRTFAIGRATPGFAGPDFLYEKLPRICNTPSKTLSDTPSDTVEQMFDSNPGAFYCSAYGRQHRQERPPAA